MRAGCCDVLSIFVLSKWQCVAHPTRWRIPMSAPRRVSASGAPKKFQNCHMDKTNMGKTSQHYYFVCFSLIVLGFKTQGIPWVTLSNHTWKFQWWIPPMEMTIIHPWVWVMLAMEMTIIHPAWEELLLWWRWPSISVWITFLIETVIIHLGVRISLSM